MPASRIVFHLGCPKTGTTFLQELMWHHRDQLGDAGVLYSSLSPEANFRAAVDLVGEYFNGWHDPLVDGAWGRLVDTLRRTRAHTAVISHELFSSASEEVAARALADLSFADVELVLTVRDLDRQIAASWQEDLKNGHFMSFQEYAQAICPDNDIGEWYGDEFWRRQDAPRVLRRWARDLPTHKVHLVTLPRRGSGPDELWGRFASVVGVSPSVADPRAPELRGNRSLGQREATLLRRVNARVEGQVPWPVYGEVMVHLAEQVFGRTHDPIVVPPEHRGWVARCSAEMVEALRGSGHRVVGDVNELLVDAAAPVTARHPDTADDAELLETAVEALARSLFLDPVPPPRAPALPRSVALGQRVLWLAYGAAACTRDRFQGVARPGPGGRSEPECVATRTPEVGASRRARFGRMSSGEPNCVEPAAPVRAPGRVVAVVVTYDRLALLRMSLRAVLGQTLPVDAVVVVDNASTDGTSGVVRSEFPTVDLLALRRNTGGAGGFAVGLQRALEEHGADHVWLLDDDTVPRSDALEHLVATWAARPEAAPALVASRVVWSDGRDHPLNTPRPSPFAGAAERRAAAAIGCVPVRSASFVSVLVAADAARAAGLPVADYFLWNDDFEFTARLLRDRPGLLCPSSVVEHHTRIFGGTEVDPGERFYYEVRNKAWLFTRSPGLRPVERAVYAGSSLARWGRTLSGSQARGTLARAARRGLADGLRAGPRPNEVVLADARSEDDT